MKLHPFSDIEFPVTSQISEPVGQIIDFSISPLLHIYIYIYHLFVAMLHITVVQYEKGDRQTKKVQGKNRLSGKKVKISTRTWKAYQDIAMYIKIYQDIWDMGQVMEAQPPRSPVLLFLTAKPGNEAAAPPRPHPHHTSKSAYMTKKFLSVFFSEFTYAIQPITDTK